MSMSMTNMDARVLYAVGAFMVDLSMLHRGTRRVSEHLWKSGENGCVITGSEPQFDCDFGHDGSKPTTLLEEWKDDELVVFHAGVAHIVGVWWTDNMNGKAVFTWYRDRSRAELDKRKLPVFDSGYDVRL